MSLSAKEKSQRSRNKKKIWYLAFIKTQCCAHCGNSDHRVLEWHHKDHETKFMKISKMLSTYSINAIKREIAKCLCLCANCHRILHYHEKGKIRKTKLPLVKLDI
jgi:hypothetical protein